MIDLGADHSDGSNLALDVMKAALSLAVKRFTEGENTVTEVEIERAAVWVGVGEDDTDQIMLVFDLLIAFGNSLTGKAKVTVQ